MGEEGRGGTPVAKSKGDAMLRRLSKRLISLREAISATAGHNAGGDVIYISCNDEGS